MKLNRSVRLRRAGLAVREGEWCVFCVGIAGFEIVTVVVVVTVTGIRVRDVSLATVAGTVVAPVARSCRAYCQRCGFRSCAGDSLSYHRY